MFRIHHKFDVEQVSEVFQVLAMRALSLVLFSRLTISFPFPPFYFLPLAVCGWKKITREKELDIAGVVSLKATREGAFHCCSPFSIDPPVLRNVGQLGSGSVKGFLSLGTKPSAFWGPP